MDAVQVRLPEDGAAVFRPSQSLRLCSVLAQAFGTPSRWWVTSSCKELRSTHRRFSGVPPFVGGRRDGAFLPQAPSGFDSRTAPSIFRPPIIRGDRRAVALLQRHNPGSNPGARHARLAYRPDKGDRPREWTLSRDCTFPVAVTHLVVVESVRSFASRAGVPGSNPGRGISTVV